MTMRDFGYSQLPPQGTPSATPRLPNSYMDYIKPIPIQQFSYHTLATSPKMKLTQMLGEQKKKNATLKQSLVVSPKKIYRAPNENALKNIDNEEANMQFNISNVIDSHKYIGKSQSKLKNSMMRGRDNQSNESIR